MYTSHAFFIQQSGNTYHYHHQQSVTRMGQVSRIQWLYPTIKMLNVCVPEDKWERKRTQKTFDLLKDKFWHWEKKPIDLEACWFPNKFPTWNNKLHSREYLTQEMKPCSCLLKINTLIDICRLFRTSLALRSGLAYCSRNNDTRAFYLGIRHNVCTWWREINIYDKRLICILYLLESNYGKDMSLNLVWVETET